MRAEATSFQAAEFGDSALDDAVFVRCDLRAASFARKKLLVLGTNRGARFESSIRAGTAAT